MLTCLILVSLLLLAFDSMVHTASKQTMVTMIKINNNYYSLWTPSYLISGWSVNQYALYSLIFNHYSTINREQHKISSINLAIMVCPIIKAHAPVINQKEGVLLGHSVSLCFVSNYFVTFQAKNTQRSALVNTALIVLH